MRGYDEKEREREPALRKTTTIHMACTTHIWKQTHTCKKIQRERERETMNIISERFRGCEGGPYLHNKYTQTNATIR